MRKPYMNYRNGKVEIPLQLGPEELYDRGRRILGLEKIRASNYTGDERKAELQLTDNARLVIENDKDFEGFYKASLKTWVSRAGFHADSEGRKTVRTYPRDFSLSLSPKETRLVANSLKDYPIESGLPQSREMLEGFVEEYAAQEV